jgi:photosystem II stability/assembly factor-like uncharacterized protein
MSSSFQFLFSTSVILTLGSLATALPACTHDVTGDRSTTWTNRTKGTAAGSRPWNDVASDSTGAHLVAISGRRGLEPDGSIWTSSNGGATWTNRTASTPAAGFDWGSVASDSSGTHLVAVALIGAAGPSSSGDVWTSADAGATWTKRTSIPISSGRPLGPVVSDSTGARLVVAAGDVWSSTDSGATWTDVTMGTPAAAQSWVGMAADATATRWVGVTAHGDIWTSSDSGATWINRTAGMPASGHSWAGVASDAAGANLVAVDQPTLSADGVLSGGDIWTSQDAGKTWTNRTQGTSSSGVSWETVASDASGAHLLAASAHGQVNDLFTSDDSGLTWTDAVANTAAAGAQWIAVASDAAGAHLIAVSDNSAQKGGRGGSPCCFGDVWTN